MLLVIFLKTPISFLKPKMSRNLLLNFRNVHLAIVRLRYLWIMYQLISREIFMGEKQVGGGGLYLLPALFTIKVEVDIALSKRYVRDNRKQATGS